MFNYVLIKHKQMSFVSNGGKFKLYTVLNGFQNYIYISIMTTSRFHLSLRQEFELFLDFCLFILHNQLREFVKEIIIRFVKFKIKITNYSFT
jgi:hypothetical protein